MHTSVLNWNTILSTNLLVYYDNNLLIGWFLVLPVTDRSSETKNYGVIIKESKASRANVSHLVFALLSVVKKVNNVSLLSTGNE